MLSAARFFALHLPFVYSPSAAPSVLLPSAMLFSALSLRLFPSHHPAPAPSNTIPIAPSFPIPPSRARTVKHHLRRTVFSHPAIPRPHRQTPSPSLRLFPSHHPVPAPSISIPYAPSFSILPSRAPTVFLPPRFSARFRPAIKKIEKTSKKCKKGVDKSNLGWYYIKAVCERTAAAAAAAPLPHSGRTLKIKQCMTERNT